MSKLTLNEGEFWIRFVNTVAWRPDGTLLVTTFAIDEAPEQTLEAWL
jgi:hypothetical protein